MGTKDEQSMTPIGQNCQKDNGVECVQMERSARVTSNTKSAWCAATEGIHLNVVLATNLLINGTDRAK